MNRFNTGNLKNKILKVDTYQVLNIKVKIK